MAPRDGVRSAGTSCLSLPCGQDSEHASRFDTNVKFEWFNPSTPLEKILVRSTEPKRRGFKSEWCLPSPPPPPLLIGRFELIQ